MIHSHQIGIQFIGLLILRQVTLHNLTISVKLFHSKMGNTQSLKDPVHSGQHAALLEIEEQGTDASYLFFYKSSQEAPFPTKFYLSSWVYLPEDTCSGNWWNTFQFKSSPDGDSSNSDSVHSLNMRHGIEDDCSTPLEYQLFSKVPATPAIHIQENPIPIPLAQWFHVEVYYERSDSCGQVTVWQDGEEIFNLECTPTVYSTDTLYTSINNYAQDLSNLYYVDDIVLSAERLGPVTIQNPCANYSGGDNWLSDIQNFFASLACER